MRVKNQKGFSLVEIMVTIAILSILISISLFSYNSSINRAKISSIKSNMRTFQMTVEIFANDNGGAYPSSLEQLKQISIAKGYWKNIKNPFNNVENDIVDLNLNPTLNEGQIGYKSGNEQSVISLGKLDFVLKYASLDVVSDAITSPSTSVTSYFIVGADQNGNSIKESGDSMFVLTNGSYSLAKNNVTTTSDNATNDTSNTSSSDNNNEEIIPTPTATPNSSINTPSSVPTPVSSSVSNNNSPNNGNGNSNQNSQEKGDNKYDRSGNSNK